MKRCLALLVVIATQMLQSVGVCAKIGDVYTYTKYTDINAYINNYVIPSYNIEGYTGVVAEDLRYYGFDVVWSETERTLKITRNTSVNKIETYLQPTQTSPIYLGKNAYSVLITDIRTFINDIEVVSYNIGGKTVIRFDSLAAFGDVNWDENARKIKLWVRDGLKESSYELGPKPLPKKTLYSADGRSIEVYEHEVSSYLNVGWYKTKEEADAVKNRENEAKNRSKNQAAVKNFYVGQQVCEWLLLGTRYGTVRQIDSTNGKVKVYWNRVVDSKGKEMDYLSGSLYFSLYSETWENASSVKPLY